MILSSAKNPLQVRGTKKLYEACNVDTDCEPGPKFTIKHNQNGTSKEVLQKRECREWFTVDDKTFNARGKENEEQPVEGQVRAQKVLDREKGRRYSFELLWG